MFKTERFRFIVFAAGEFALEIDVKVPSLWSKTINLNLSVLTTQDASITGSNFSNIEVDFSTSRCV